MIKHLFKTITKQAHKETPSQPLYQSAGVTSEQFAAHWMPFSGNRDFKQNPRMIVGARGLTSLLLMAEKSLTACQAFGQQA